MKHTALILVVTLALLAGACSSGGTSSVPDDVTPEGDVAGEGVVYGCQTADDCQGKTQPGECEKIDCINNMCATVPVLNGTSCDDEDACTENDQCTMGECSGDEITCDDGNECTADSCDPDAGCQVSTDTDGQTCNDGNLCTADDKCAAGQCTGVDVEQCGCVIDDDCEKYDDANLCDGVLTCQDGTCKMDAASIVDCTGTAAGPCEEVFCEEATGACATKNAADGGACDDSDECTVEDTCTAGVCDGEPVKCDDGEECTEDSCDPDAGCVFDAAADGTECNDGSLCTENDGCVAGECTGDAVPECDACMEDADCSDYEDGNLCNGTLACIDSQCVVDEETVVVCVAPGACKQNKCNPASGECEASDALDGTKCDDANGCTHSDYCSGGVCKGLPEDCDDINACTADSCDPDSGCVNAPKAGDCGDGDPCTINDQCVDGACMGDPNPDCQCETDDDCEDEEDGDMCNGTLVCEDKKCVVDEATIVDCSIPGLDSCMVADCDPDSGYCSLTQFPDGADCDDLNECTDSDTCYGGICKGMPMFCDDDNICTDDSCDPNVGCVHAYNTADCDDGSTCTLNDYCAQGFCTGDPNPECVCQNNGDCAQFEDGDLCNGTLICKGFKCAVDQATVVACDKSNDTDCLVTYCTPQNGQCVTAAFEDGKPCSDNDACTLVDVCLDGQCMGNQAPVCVDENPCTDDTCEPAFGCTFVPNDDGCDDLDPCTGGDFCADGVCQPGDVDLCGDTCIPDWTLSCGGSDGWGTDKSGATDVVDSYDCSPWDYTGAEYTYTFVAPYDALVTVTLADEEADTDLIVLENMGDGCDPDQCRDWDFATVTFEATSGTNYYFVVDGYEGGFLPAEGAYTISVDCVPLSEMNCADGEDDDLDGFTDCDDEDCLGTPECPLPICDPSWTLDCNGTDSWANYDFGSTNAIEEYACSPWAYEGPEYTYIWVAPFTKTVTVKLSEETAETDLIVLSDAGEGICDPDVCVDFGLSEVTFEAEAGLTYYFVVDGWAGAEGSYTITLECPPDVESLCDDEEDNDQDGKFDCDDEDCMFADNCAADCNPWAFTFDIGCDFEEDYLNYGVFSTNKADTYVCTEDNMSGPEYVYNFVAPYDTTVTVTLTNETAETDILLVEEDPDMGCLATNCVDHDFGTIEFQASQDDLFYLVVDGYDGAEGSYHISVQCTPETEQVCWDGEDDDEDGLVDCADGDCFGMSPDCQSACQPDDVSLAQITCGSTDAWSTDDVGSYDNVDAYSCNSYNYEGSEYTYTVTVDEPTTVTINVTEEDEDANELDVLLLEDAGLGCNPATCIDWNFKTVTFDAVPDTTYYLVVDGYNGAQGSYVLEVVCD